MAGIAAHATGDIGLYFPLSVAGLTALGEGIQLLLVDSLAGAVFIENGDSLSRNICNEPVAPFKMLRGQ